MKKTITWKYRSTHNGTRVCHQAMIGNRTVAQINMVIESSYSVFQPGTGKWEATYATVKEAKEAVEQALAMVPLAERRKGRIAPKGMRGHHQPKRKDEQHG